MLYVVYTMDRFPEYFQPIVPRSSANERTYLTVKDEDRDIVKRLGGIYDFEKGRWFVSRLSNSKDKAELIRRFSNQIRF